MVRWKALLVLMMSLWLPLQGLAAVVMPYCQHSLGAGNHNVHGVDRAAAADEHAAHLDHHESALIQDHTSPSNLLTACDDCGNCHLSAATALPSTEIRATPVQATAAPHSTTPALAGIVPHRLNRPPLLA